VYELLHVHVYMINRPDAERSGEHL